MDERLIHDIESNVNNERIVYDFNQLKGKECICTLFIILLGMASYVIVFIYLIKEEDGSL